MCDTIYVPANRSKSGVPLFAKNSDRDPNEAHLLEMHPAGTYQPGQEVRCTYTSIPQVRRTNATLLARPFWIWGAEMGANEHGLVIGNEAVFTRISYMKQGGLTGMDLLRLALERADSAESALHVITDLLARHGQGGNCGYLHPFYYHNSFLIADPKDAWVLETAGSHWAAEHVSGIRTISNALTIGDHWDLASPDLVSYAVDRGWCKSRYDFNFASIYSDPIYTFFADGRGRHACTTTELLKGSDLITAADLMALLRHHRRGEQDSYSPDKGLIGADICMHAAVGPIRINETTGSMVSELTKGDQLHWFTASSAPCTGIFKPVWFAGSLPDQRVLPTGKADPDSYWWLHERLHRAVLRDYSNRLGLYEAERNDLEQEFLQQSGKVSQGTSSQKAEFSSACFEKAKNAEKAWLKKVEAAEITSGTGFLYNQTRLKFDKLADL
jgi:dipeptidase